MTPVTYTLVGDGEESNIVVFVPGEGPLVAHSTHPNFEAIVNGALVGDPAVIGLFDISATIATKFHRLSERITVAHGRVYLDGEEIANTLTEHILRVLDSGIEDFRPLVNFFENVQSNPSEHSREQLYSWLAARDFTITTDGMIVGYKGVRKGDDGLFSIQTGRAIVNDEVQSGNIPQPLGAVIEMPRSEVAHDPYTGCSTGLHVGDYNYANGFAQGALLEVHVNPRDVVSVPNECDAAKMRVCRYVVVDTIDAPYTVPVLYDYESDGDFYDEDGDYNWGETDGDPDWDGSW